MSVLAITCAWCGKTSFKVSGSVNRAAAIGAPLYCDRVCAGLGRRKGKTVPQKRAEKAAYDREYRATNLSLIKAKKAAHFKKTYDPIEAAKARKLTMPRHVEYCRQPAYRLKKKKYDSQRRASEFGEFGEAYQLLIDLNREVKGRMSNEQIAQTNDTFNKRQKRRRGQEAEGQTRYGRRRDPASYG